MIRFRKSLTAALVALGLTVAPLAVQVTRPASAQAAAVPAAGFQLVRGADNAAVAALDAALPNVTVAGVLDDANRTATRISASEGAAMVRNFAAGFHWQSGDNTTTAWMPQGVTTSSDAYGNGLYQDRKVVLVSWYDSSGTAPNKGVRVSFVDRTDPLNPVYRHVLLVEPYTVDGVATYRSVPIHAGGMFWYGDLLYVVDTSNGFRVFDLDHIWRVSTTDGNAIGRQADGSHQAYGYKYVLPQKFRYTPRAGSAADGLRYSFTSLDRTTTPDSVLVGEYSSTGDGTRLVRWSIDYTTRELTTSGGYATAVWAYQVDIRSMQGVASVDGKYFVSRSNGRNTRGDLITWRPGQYATVHSGVWPEGPEDLTYRGSTDELWTAPEYAGNRSVVSVTAGSF